MMGGIHLHRTGPFTGIQFYLAGFTDPNFHHQVKSSLENLGAVDSKQYAPRCTHVIVDNLVFDDPICVRARRDRKILVNTWWLEQSLDVELPLDASPIVYRPPKDLGGIPGAKQLVICLTGYQKPLRSDIMMMVELMGAQFSKVLMTAKVTHLICHKFEGEKYEAAKKNVGIKLINHYWLEDCLKAWKIIPEEPYTKCSSYELEMEGVVKDSEEETGDIAGNLTEGRNINTIPNLQNETLGAQHHSMVSSKVSSPSAQQGLPNSAKTNDMKFLIKEEIKSDQAQKSRKLNQMDQQSPRRFGIQDQIYVKSDNMCDQNVYLPTNQVGNELPSTSGNAKVSVDSEAEKSSSLGSSRKASAGKSSPSLHFGEDLESISRESSKRLADFSTGKSNPLGTRKSPRKSSLSPQTAGKLVNSDGRQEVNIAEKVIGDLQTPYLESDKEKDASAFVKVPSSKPLADSDSGKRSPLSSRSARRSSLALRTEEKLGSTVGNLQESSADMCTSDVGAEKENTVSDCLGVPSTRAGSLDEERPGDLLPQKRKVDGQPNVSLGTPKSQKLTTSASKRIDAAEPANTTPVSSPLVKSKNATLNLTNHLGDDSAKPSSSDMSSLNVSSVKSKAKSITASQKLASEMLQGIKSTNMPDATSPDTSSFATSTSLNTVDKNAGTNYQQQNTSSPGTKDLEIAKSVSPNLNADDQTGNFVSKPPRKKTVARRTLGSRPKLNKKCTTKKASVDGNPFQDDAAIHLDGELEENHASYPIRDKLMTDTPEMQVAVDMRSDPVMKSGNEINDCAGTVDNETEVPPEHDVQNEKLSAAETGSKKQKYVSQKKRISGKTMKKAVLGAEETPNDANKAEGEKSSKEALIKKEELVVVAGKKRSGTLSSKSEGPAEVEKESEPIVGNDQGTSKVQKHTGKLAGKKRRGTLLLNKPGGLVEVERENEPVHGESKSKEEKHNVKLASKSNLIKGPVEAEKENDPSVGNDQSQRKSGKRAGKLAGKKRRGTLVLNKPEGPVKVRKENEPAPDAAEGESNEELTEMLACKSNLTVMKSDETAVTTNPLNIQQVNHEPACFILSGHKLQRKEFQQLIKRLKGRLCRDTHQWSYQATHFVVPDPLRRTEKFFAAAASGRWILKTDYLTSSSQAGKFLPEEPFEWHKNGLSEDGAINLEAPRKWRLLREKTGHGAFYGMRIIIYGECIAPPLDTLKRVVKAGDGTILATSPPYTRFLKSGLDFAIVSPGIPRVDVWVQEFLRHEIPCVLADYLVEYVCKPGYSLERHVQYSTHEWASKSYSKLMSLSEECVTDVSTPENQDSADLACQVCGSSDRGDVMLICGDESGSTGCGIGTHIDCCDPPFEDIPEEDWFCPKCSESRDNPPGSTKKKARSEGR